MLVSILYPLVEFKTVHCPLFSRVIVEITCFDRNAKSWFVMANATLGKRQNNPSPPTPASLSSLALAFTNQDGGSSIEAYDLDNDLEE